MPPDEFDAGVINQDRPPARRPCADVFERAPIGSREGVRAGGGTHFRKARASRNRRLQGRCERRSIPRRHDPASLSFPNPFRRAVVASCHHGHAAGHGFSHRERRAVFERRQDEKLRSLEDGQRIARLASD